MEKYPVNFEEIKRKISIEDVVNYFQLDLKEVKPQQFRGNCPFPNHGGDRNSKSFSINNNLFICPTHCGGSSGVINFYCELKGYDRERDSLKAVKELQDIFCNEIAIRTEGVIMKTPVKEKKENKVYKHRLDVELNVDYLLKTKKFTFETLISFGLGKAKYGVLKDCIAVAMHNKHGYPIGYAGQNTETGKWKFYFNKSIEIFNYHRVKQLKKVRRLIIVESFYSAMYLYQCGFKNVVAIMGIWASAEQIKLIKELSDNFLLFLDNDEAGKKGMEKLSKEFDTQNMKYWLISNPDKRKPLDYSPIELHKIIS